MPVCSTPSVSSVNSDFSIPDSDNTDTTVASHDALAGACNASGDAASNASGDAAGNTSNSSNTSGRIVPF